jgi:hypothetical protein
MNVVMALYVVAAIMIGFLAGNLMCHLVSRCKNKILQEEPYE